MTYRCGQFFFCLFFFCMSVSAVVGQEQSTEAGFVKLDAQGQQLPMNAEQWAMVGDKESSLVWEVKTTDSSIHDRDKTFSWDGAQESFLAELNSNKFGGFSDWRLPTTDELRTIRVKGAEPYINQTLFPNTVSTGYLSWRKCGNGDIYDERVKFGKIRNTKKDRRVRAVRSGLE